MVRTRLPRRWGVPTRLIPSYSWVSFQAARTRVDVLQPRLSVVSAKPSYPHFSQKSQTPPANIGHSVPDLNPFWNAQNIFVSLDERSLGGLSEPVFGVGIVRMDFA